MLIIRGLFGGFIQVAIFAALLFIPAGTWHWPRAWQFLGAYGLVMAVSIIMLAKLAPESLAARLQRPSDKSQPMADRIVTTLLILSMLAWFAFVSMDVFHMQLLPKPHLIVSVFGAVFFFTGYGICMVSIYQNAFAAPIVKDQSERGQVLVDTGLYGLIRHPLYLGMLPYLAGLALWLESFAGVFTVLVVLFFLVLRIFVEEKTLQRTLPGYTEYMAKVRCRLIPFVW